MAIFATVRATVGFYGKLSACFAELWTVAGTADVITSAGAYHEKPGFHGKGRAFDLDALFWPGRTLVTRDDHNDLYLGVEAVIRRHFGTVLDYLYNAAHRDHYHFDDGSRVGFRSSSRSMVLYAQAALNAFEGAGLAIDGIWGPLTRGALKRSEPDVANPESWRGLLLRWAREGCR